MRSPPGLFELFKLAAGGDPLPVADEQSPPASNHNTIRGMVPPSNPIKTMPNSPTPDAGSQAQKSQSAMGLLSLPKQAHVEDQMNAQPRPMIQDLVRMSMEKSASRAQITDEGTRQLQRAGVEDSHTKEASAQNDTEVSTDFAEKLANAVEFVVPGVLKQAEIDAKKVDKPFPTGVTETIGGKNPLWDARSLGHSKTHTLPLNPPMEHEGKMKTDMEHRAGGDGHQQTSLQAGHGKIAEDMDAFEKGAAIKRLVQGARHGKLQGHAKSVAGRAAEKVVDAAKGAKDGAGSVGKKLVDAAKSVREEVRPKHVGSRAIRAARSVVDAASKKVTSEKGADRVMAAHKTLDKARRHRGAIGGAVLGTGAAAGAGGAYAATRKKESFDMSSVKNLATRAANSSAGSKIVGAAKGAKDVLTGQNVRDQVQAAKNWRAAGVGSKVREHVALGRAAQKTTNRARAGVGAAGLAAAGGAGYAATRNKDAAAKADRSFRHAVSSLGERGRKAGVDAWEASKPNAIGRKIVNKAKDVVDAVGSRAKTDKGMDRADKARSIVNKARKHQSAIGGAAIGTAAAGAAGTAAAIRGRKKEAEDAINPSRITAGKAVPPETSTSNQPSKKVDGPTQYLQSNKAAINFTKRDAYGKIKKDNLPYWQEKMMTQSADPVLHEAFKHTRQAGAKIASGEVVEKTAAARSLLAQLAEAAKAGE